MIALPPPDRLCEDDLVEALCDAADPAALVATIHAASAAGRIRLAGRLAALLDPDLDDEVTARARRAGALMVIERPAAPTDDDPEPDAADLWRRRRRRTMARRGGGKDPFGFSTRGRR